MLALLYDIHGNLPALEAVLEDAEGAGADRFILGGDYAAFGAWPAETVERLRGLDAALAARQRRPLDRSTPRRLPSRPGRLSSAAASCWGTSRRRRSQRSRRA